MELIIVRHGETRENREGIIQGHIYGTLNEYGKMQIRKLASILGNKKIDAIFSSDLERTVGTTRAILRYQKTVPVHFVKSLRERNPGVFHGRTTEEFTLDEEKSGLGKARYRPRGGESMIDVYKRVRRFTQGINKKYGRKTVLIVSHGIVIKCLASIYLRIPLITAAELKTTNAGVLILRVRGGKGAIIEDAMFKNSDAVLG